jgi:D-glycero-D-manno-heptose 1,7-bisphosphate phosphatase
MLERAVFLDRDNTIIENDGYLGDPSRVKLLPGAATALAAMRALGYRLIVVSNQSGVARGLFDENAVEAVNAEMSRQLQEQAGAYIDASYYCPYHPEASLPEYRVDHDWRKPKPGMLRQAAADFRLDLAQSWMIGDQNRDIGAGAAAGCRTILLKDPDRAPATETDRATNVSPSFVVRTLADAARIIAREGRNPPPVPPAPPAPASTEVAAPAAGSPAEPSAATPAPAAVREPAPPPPGPSPAATALHEATPDHTTDSAPRSTLPASAPTGPNVVSPSRTDRLLEELIAQLRQQNRHAELREDFSRGDMGLVLLQLLAAASLIVALAKFIRAPVSFRNGTWGDFFSDFFLAHFARQEALFWATAAVVFQGMVIALLLRNRRR